MKRADKTFLAGLVLGAAMTATLTVAVPFLLDDTPGHGVLRVWTAADEYIDFREVADYAYYNDMGIIIHREDGNKNFAAMPLAVKWIEPPKKKVQPVRRMAVPPRASTL